MKNSILKYLNALIPEPRCELNYNKDYELLISVMLSAQTTDKRVNEVTSILYSRYDDLDKLNKASVDDIEDVIRPLGNQHKKAVNVKGIVSKIILNDYKLPNDRKFLESLPGVGRKTANVVLSTLFHEQCLAVDTHIARVAKRLGLALDDDDVNEIEIKLTNYFSGYDLCRLHHQLLLFGRYHCKAINPNCDCCKLKNICKKKLD